MKAEISSLTEQLQPASDDAVTARILSLHNAGLAWPPGIDGKSAARVYGFALKGLPGEALKRTVTRIIRGEVEEIKSFMPTPPQLAVMVRMEARPLLDARARARETIESLTANRAGTVRDPASVARVRDLVRKVKDDAAEVREASRRGYTADLPISHEQAETYKRMLDLPDRPGADDADTAAFRRRIVAKIENADPPLGDEPPQGRYFKALQQQEEMENDGKDQAQGGSEGEDRGDPLRGPEGQQERDAGDGEFRGGEREDD